MATLINEQRMIENQATMYEERVHTPLRKYNDKSWTPTRYWHIHGGKTTLDQGYGGSAGVIGPTSSLRYVVINNLPLSGIETIVPQVQSGDYGIDTSYESEAITLDGTIRPFENDFFMITYLKTPWIFRVTKVEYDKLASDSIFKIQFVLEYVDAGKIDELMAQTLREYVCIWANIGTDEKCIIEKADAGKIEKINDMYAQIADSYINFYYNRRYNCFLADFIDGTKLYDPLQEMFISKHRLFTQKNQIDGIVLPGQFNDKQRELKYQKSIYRYVELKRREYLTNFGYTVFAGCTNPQTAFSAWLDNDVFILDIPRIPQDKMPYYILSDEFVNIIKMNGETPSVQAELIKRYVRGENLGLSDIDLSLHNEILNMDSANLEVFFFTPIIMYIIHTILKEHLKRRKNFGGSDYFDV